MTPNDFGQSLKGAFQPECDLCIFKPCPTPPEIFTIGDIKLLNTGITTKRQKLVKLFRGTWDSELTNAFLALK